MVFFPSFLLCPLASHAEGNPVDFNDVIAKLGLCVDVAKAVWSDAE